MANGGRESWLESLRAYAKPGRQIENVNGLPTALDGRPSEGRDANAYYFSHPKWMADWIQAVHRYPELRDRWMALAGSWDDRIIIDIGCGPGNLFATIGGKPKLLIGVDVAPGSLEIAIQQGYVPLLSDAHDLPFRDGFADMVTINGSLHHCEVMEQVLSEAARILKPGGVLAIDHDPQKSAWNFRGLGKLLWEIRRPIYRWLKRGGHSPIENEQTWAAATELHHGIGRGTSEALFRGVLEPLGFVVELYPHNHKVGRDVVKGKRGRAPLKIILAQVASGRWPFSPGSALTLFCVARKQTIAQPVRKAA